MTPKAMVRVPISIQRMRDLLVSAFEGGSNYWYLINGKQLRAGLKMADFKEGGSQQPKGDYYHWSQLIPTVRGCALFRERSRRI